MWFQNDRPILKETRRLGMGLLLWLSGCGPQAIVPPSVSPQQDRPTPEAKAVIPFRDAAEEVGLTFRHDNGMTGERYILEIMGPGSALFDFDGDGDLDLFLVQGRSLDKTEFAKADSPSIHRLFRNDLSRDETGQPVLKFVDVTTSTGLTFSDYGMGAIAGDYDRDGHIDLYVTNFGHDRLLRNTGSGTFEDVTQVSELTAPPAWSTSASFADYDGDGWLDLFVCQYLDWTLDTHVACKSPWGGHGYCGPKTFPASRSRLYHNERNGTFQDVSESSLINSKPGAALGVVGADLDEDGWTDFFVANDAMPNHLWINQHNGTFQDEALVRGCAVNADGMSEGNMGIIAADFFNEGHSDLFITHLRTEHATFFRNLGNGMFMDITASLGLDAPTRPYTGFGTAAIDYDNDGALDIFITNGSVQINPEQEKSGIAPPLRQRSLLFHNVGTSGPEFVPLTDTPCLDVEEIGRGAAFGDLDQDGDVDIIVNNNHGPVRLLLNEAGQTNHWLGVRLVEGSKEAVFDALGAVAQLERSGSPTLTRRCATDGSYLSASDPRLIFGLGDSCETGTLHVRWPDGSSDRWEGLDCDRYHTLRKATSLSFQAAK